MSRTLVAVVGSFLVTAFFLVTPVGLAPLTAGTFFVLALVVFLRVMAGAVSTVGKMRGLELPVAERVPSRGIMATVSGGLETTAN